MCNYKEAVVRYHCLKIFKDIIPGYRIRIATEKEKQQTVSNTYIVSETPDRYKY